MFRLSETMSFLTTCDSPPTDVSKLKTMFSDAQSRCSYLPPILALDYGSGQLADLLSCDILGRHHKIVARTIADFGTEVLNPDRLGYTKIPFSGPMTVTPSPVVLETETGVALKKTDF